MSVTSSLYLSTNDKTLRLPEVANAIQRICDISTVDFLFSQGSDESSSKYFMGKEEYERFLPQDTLSDYVLGNRKLHVDADTAGIVERLESIQRATIPSEVRGEILLDRFSLFIGRGHFAAHETLNVYYRVCFAFWGYSTPPDCAGFKSSLNANKEFHLLVAELEHATGSLERHFIFG